MFHDAQPGRTPREPRDIDGKIISSKYANYALILLFLCSFIHYVDRQSIFPMFETIKKDLNLTDFQLGLVGSAFMWVYSVIALPMAWLSDKGKRTKIIGVGVIVWSVFTAATSRAANFAQLFLVRALVGVGEGTYAPSVNALVCDYFPPRKRNTVVSLITSNIILGSAVGMILGGQMVDRIGWRTVFLIIGPPGILLGLLAWSLREPRKGSQEHYVENDDRADQAIETTEFNLHHLAGTVKLIFVLRTMTFLFITGAFVTFALGGLLQWIFPYMERKFGLKAADASLQAGLPVILAMVAGVIFSGVWADRAAKRSRKAPVYIMCFGLALSAPFFCAFLFMNDAWACIAVFSAGSFFMSWYNGLSNSLQLSLIEPNRRAVLVAIFIFFIHIFGDAFSPVIIGFLSDHFSAIHGPTEGLRRAFFMVPAAAVLASGTIFLTLPWVERDLDDVGRRLQARINGKPA